VATKSKTDSRQQGQKKSRATRPSSKGAPHASTQHAVVPSYAKLNLDLRVLHRRPDGFHEIRTIYQTVSLHDEIEIEFRKARNTSIELDSSADIDDNIILKAARSLLEYIDVSAHVRFSLRKKIPIGGGLGGGSSNAAAVLLALPALAKQRLGPGVLHRLASWLGSDVPFFLYGGTALGLGRGTELYPLPDLDPVPGVVVPGGVHVSTAEAYSSLGRPTVSPQDESGATDTLTSDDGFPILGEFQAVTWALGGSPLSSIDFKNDFEPVVLARHASLNGIAKRLRDSGAKPVRMTGSGSAVFGLTENSAAAKRIANEISGAIPIKFVTRNEYRRRWREALGEAASYSALAR
jgi:4-diphosphocytidyl-2-C-methyl-D-erythritol kinase